MAKKKLTKQKPAAIESAAAFRDSLVPRADKMEHGKYPLWYGWAICEAYMAGYRAALAVREKDAAT